MAAFTQKHFIIEIEWAIMHNNRQLKQAHELLGYNMVI